MHCCKRRRVIVATPAPTPASDLAAWRKQVAAVLRKSGKLAVDDEREDPEAHLTTRTYDGIDIKPLYTRADAPDPSEANERVKVAHTERADSSAWDVRTLHAGTDPHAARCAVLKDLECGASSAWLRIGDGYLPLGSLGEVLADVYLELAPVSLDAGADSLAAADEFLAVCTERGADPSKVRGELGLDPYGLLARTGAELDVVRAAELAARVAVSHPKLRTMLVDATAFHGAGASDATELGISMAIGTAYLRALLDAGLNVDTAASQIAFRYAVNCDQFLGIAKLRAARVLWARVCEVAGASEGARKQVQHAVTSVAMMTQRDPWNNMLRGTVAAFAAGTGGADAVTVLPFDAAIGQSDDFARRIARATQALLLEESNVGRVADPAGGSWYVESLTQALTDEAWRVFQALESGGGWADSWARAEPQIWLSKARSERGARIAKRRVAITGVSEFASIQEQPLQRPAWTDGAALAQALPQVRDAQAFEALRDRSDGHLTRTGLRPRLVLRTVGDAASYTPRVSFVANLLQAGGIEPVYDAPMALRVACLCGSDQDYALYGDAAIAALRAAGVKYVMIAGKNSRTDVDESVVAGCDAVAVLSALLQRLEVQ